MKLKTLIKTIKAEAAKRGFKIILVDKKYVTIPGSADSSGCTGYFDPEAREIVVATRRAKKVWIGTLIHEFCHLEQFSQDMFHDAFHDDDWLDPWIEGRIKTMSEKLLRKRLIATIECELDCERRAVSYLKKLTDYKINIREYIRAANAYVFFYHYAIKYRRWFNPNKPIYSQKDLLKKMPTTLYGVNYFEPLDIDYTPYL